MIARFLKDRSGASAVEFALIAPVFAAVVTAGWGLWQGQEGIEHAKTALHAGAEYYDTAGNNDTTAQTLVQNAWPSKPADARVTTARACYCNGTVIDCSTPCGIGQKRTVFVTLAVAWTGQGAFANQPQSLQEVLRVL
jgi:Flp pilus assembly protein TadG